MSRTKHIAVGMLVSACLVIATVCLRSRAQGGDESVQKAGKPPATQAQSLRQYTVECRIISKLPSDTIRVLKIPTVTVREGEKKLTSDTSQKPFVIAIQHKGSVSIPLSRVFLEGITLEVTVLGDGNQKAILDASFELSHPEAAPAEDGQSVRVTTNTRRVVECVSLGKKVVASFSDMDIEAAVNVLP